MKNEKTFHKNLENNINTLHQFPVNTGNQSAILVDRVGQ